MLAMSPSKLSSLAHEEVEPFRLLALVLEPSKLSSLAQEEVGPFRLLLLA